MKPQVLFIDNFDSFTFNLVEAFERLGCTVRVLRNTVDSRTALALADSERALIVLSPGPGTPRDAGCCLDLIGLALGKVPLLGICLGHQAIVEQAGGAVVRAPEPVHGKASRIDHDGEGPLRGLESPLTVGRYHSLCTRDLPPRFRVHAQVGGMAMAISDPNAMQTGLQFHPESILTLHGDAILRNVLALAAGLKREAEPEDAAGAGHLRVGVAGS
ncbi:aminodeoxychorismate/anthranilate synthase component II [Sphingosinicella sp. CPCC 101087]|uniref:anthranilate synthase component II n=1 Tax=Sphingosinicella sp. CPCC 101087 TaxID=2497754 RepID=UPI00101E1D27|nr:aminodeoxychorismate/anthranilate synthase component II [Sphingosinicella sp. CPCC 101087]